MAKIELNQVMPSMTETELGDTFAEVMEECIKNEEPSLEDCVKTIVEMLDWKEPDKCKALHLIKNVAYIRSIGKCFHLPKDPNDVLGLHVSSSSATRLQRALATIYDHVCTCTASKILNGTYRLGVAKGSSSSYYQALSEMENIRAFLSQTERLKNAYRPQLFCCIHEECLIKNMRYFKRFEDQLKEVLAKKDELTHENDTLFDMIRNPKEYGK